MPLSYEGEDKGDVDLWSFKAIFTQICLICIIFLLLTTSLSSILRPSDLAEGEIASLCM